MAKPVAHQPVAQPVPQPIKPHVPRIRTSDEMHQVLQKVQDVQPHMLLHADDEPPAYIVEDMLREILETRQTLEDLRQVMHIWNAKLGRR